MNLGDVYRAPWGRYVVHRMAPIVLRSLDRENAFVVEITGDYQPTGETWKPGAPTPSVASIATTSASSASATDAPTLGGWRPGGTLALNPAEDQLWWKPCIKRSFDGIDTHVWYLSSTSDGSVHCWACRRQIPRAIIVPRGVMLTPWELLVRAGFASGPPPIGDRDRKPENIGEARARRAVRRLRIAVIERDQYRCLKCGFQSPSGEGLDVHHVIPFAQGGKTVVDNLDTLCSCCHCELSWLWGDEPPVLYAEWLNIAPATTVIRMLLAVRDGVELAGVPSEAIQAILQITPGIARQLLSNGRSP